MTDAAAINRLRAIAAALIAREDPHASWLAACLAEYATGARYGLTLDAALGLRPGAGERAWWQLEALEQRDKLLRATAREFFPTLSIRAAARAIAALLTRYETTTWPGARVYASLPRPDTLPGRLHALLKLGEPVTLRVIERALACCATEPPLFMAHGPGDDRAAVSEEHHVSSHKAKADARSRRSAIAAARR